MDPRLKGIEMKIKDVKRVIPVVSGKGGVGKSLISTSISLALSKKGYKVGLLDLDFQGASDHVILGYKIKDLPGEDKGVIPPIVHGVKFMSIEYYTQKHPLPLRGTDISNALIEILSISRWDFLDFLIIDMPPGLGDQLLDILRFIPKSEFLVVTTPSPLSINVVQKIIELLQEKHNILGIIENMKFGDEKDVLMLANRLHIKYLGSIPFYPELYTSIGNVKILLESDFGNKIKTIANKLLSIQGVE